MTRELDDGSRVTDELLMAFVDGELDDRETQLVSRAIAADPALAARLEIFRVTGRSLAPHFDALVRESPEAIVRAIRTAPLRAAPAFRPAWPTVKGIFEAMGLGPAPWPAFAALAVGGLLGAAAYAFSIGGGGQDPLLALQADGSWVASGKLAVVLETLPSAPADAAAGLVATSTFEATDDRYCRLYQAHRYTGVACRAGSGDWQIVAFGAGEPGAGQDSYVTSGGSGSSAVVDLVSGMMKSEAALDPATEADLIAREWRTQ